MTEEEANELDERLTRTTPTVDSGAPLEERRVDLPKFAVFKKNLTFF
jgi:hypothetical protein